MIEEIKQRVQIVSSLSQPEILIITERLLACKPDETVEFTSHECTIIGVLLTAAILLGVPENEEKSDNVPTPSNN